MSCIQYRYTSTQGFPLVDSKTAEIKREILLWVIFITNIDNKQNVELIRTLLVLV